MKKLSQLLESINEIDSLLELDFKDKKAFQKYQSIHKMKPTTKVNIAGKDTTVGDEMGDDSETPKAPKKPKIAVDIISLIFLIVKSKILYIYFEF